MSYPPPSNYGDYYESTHQQRQGINIQYRNGEQSTSSNPYASQTSYTGDAQRSQYSASRPDWSSQQQQQQNYANSSRHRTYNNDSWKDLNTSGSTYNDQTHPNSFVGQAGTREGYFSQGSSTLASQNTQGLNNLAYASVLNDAALQQTGHRAQKSSVSSTSNYPVSSGATAVNRVPSPVARRESIHNPCRPVSSSHQNDISTREAQQPMVSAAAALAGAVNRRYPQTSTSTAQSSVSPVMVNARSTQLSALRQSTSPWYQSTQPQSHIRTFSGTAQSATGNVAQTTIQQKSQPGKAGQHAQTRNQVVPKTTNRTELQTVNSISNLVSHPANQASQTQYSATVEPQPMPSYIDPTQVFNPYHKEHERRREAARAEAELKRKVEEEAEAKRRAEEAAAEMRRAEEEAEVKRQAEAAAALKEREEEQAAAAAAAAAKKKEEQMAAAAAQKAKAAKNPPNNPVNFAGAAPASSNLPNNATQSDQATQDPARQESEMASELKAMMEKIRDYRSKDPGLFQRLWEDVRKTTQGSAAPVATLHSPSPQMSMQQNLPAAQLSPSVPTASLQTHRSQPTEQQTLSRGQIHPPQPQPQPPPPAVTVTASSPKPRPKAPPKQQQARTESTPTSSTTFTAPWEPSSKPIIKHSNGYRVVVENNPEGLPDLGRFPAERRIRASYKSRSSPDRESRAQSTAQTSTPSTNERSTRPPAPPQSTPTSGAWSAGKLPPLTQALPPRGPTGGTVWPEEKRNALAEAAVRSLKGVPENASIQIDTHDIHAMLEKNPSYIDLCEMLEKRGLKFHRGQFARQLLSNVPSLTGSQSRPPPTPSSGPAPIPPGAQPPPLILGAALPAHPGSVLPPPVQHIPTPGAPASGPQTCSRPPGPVPAANFIPQPAPMPPSYGPGGPPPPMAVPNQAHNANGPYAFQNARPPPPVQFAPIPRPLKVPLIAPARPEPPPGSKEAMARKRDFSELVDLTALSDNEDYVLSRKQARIESSSPEHDPIQEYQKALSTAQDVGAAGQLLDPERPAQLQNGEPLKFNPNMPRLQPRTMAILAKPVNKEEALQKSFYDAKTVARDILIAAGRHPTERPLNAHMAGLLGKHVELNSDLGTFDWDAIDPGGPPILKIPFIDVSTAPPRFPLSHGVQSRDDLDKDKNPRLPDLDKRRVPAPAINGSVGPSREPHSPFEVITDLRPIHVRPSQAEGAEKSNISQKRRTLPDSPGSLNRSQRRSTHSPSTFAEEAVQPGIMSSGSFFESGKRRGRPPGAKHIHPSLGVMKRAAKHETERSVPAPASSTPSHPVFRCRWRGCKAHLHNLQTLRSHISKVHRPSEEDLNISGYICWWRNCQFLEVDDAGSIYPAKTFQASEEWTDHIEEDHLYPVALKHGDGPSTKHIGKQRESSFDFSRFRYHPPPQPVARTFSHLDPQTILQDRARYLSDANGRITTPDVSNTSPGDLEPDTMALLKADHDEVEQQAQRSFLKTHRTEKSGPKAVAEETLKAMSARKAKIGPGLDRGGCILVTEAQRATLVQNQGMQRVVDLGY